MRKSDPALWAWAKREAGNAQGQVNTHLAFHRDRLQGDRAVRAAEQDVGADTHAGGDFAGRAHIITGERAGRRSRGWREHGPGQGAAARDADVEPDGRYRADIGSGG